MLELQQRVVRSLSMSGVAIRLARGRDRPRAAAVRVAVRATSSRPESWEEERAARALAEAIRATDSAVWVAERDGRLVGVCTAYLDFHSVRFGRRCWVETCGRPREPPRESAPRCSRRPDAGRRPGAPRTSSSTPPRRGRTPGASTSGSARAGARSPTAGASIRDDARRVRRARRAAERREVDARERDRRGESRDRLRPAADDAAARCADRHRPGRRVADSARRPAGKSDPATTSRSGCSSASSRSRRRRRRAVRGRRRAGSGTGGPVHRRALLGAGAGTLVVCAVNKIDRARKSAIGKTLVEVEELEVADEIFP